MWHQVTCVAVSNKLGEKRASVSPVVRAVWLPKVFSRLPLSPKPPCFGQPQRVALHLHRHTVSEADAEKRAVVRQIEVRCEFPHQRSGCLAMGSPGKKVMTKHEQIGLQRSRES